MNESRPFASLSPTLLARKGSARPAMRPQLQPLGYPTPEFPSHQLQQQPSANPQDDLGWNDMGEEAEVEGTEESTSEATVLQFSPTEPAAPARVPEVIRQQHNLADRVIEPVAPIAVVSAPIPLTPRRTPTARRSALADGRRAAFTLRVDGERHLKLRLACAVEGRSAQQLVTEALDRLLSELPDLEDLAKRAKRR